VKESAVDGEDGGAGRGRALETEGDGSSEVRPLAAEVEGGRWRQRETAACSREARERAVLGGGGGAAGAGQGGAPRGNRVGDGGGMGWLGLIRPGQLGLRRVLQIEHSGKKFSFFFLFFIECHRFGKIIVLLAHFFLALIHYYRLCI